MDGLLWLSANRHLSKIPVSFTVLTPCQRSLYSTKDSIAVSIFVDVLVGLTNTLYVLDPQFVKIFAVQESRAGGLRKEGSWEPSGRPLGPMGVFEKSVKGGWEGWELPGGRDALSSSPLASLLGPSGVKGVLNKSCSVE